MVLAETMVTETKLLVLEKEVITEADGSTSNNLFYIFCHKLEYIIITDL